MHGDVFLVTFNEILQQFRKEVLALITGPQLHRLMFGVHNPQKNYGTSMSSCTLAFTDP